MTTFHYSAIVMNDRLLELPEEAVLLGLEAGQQVGVDIDLPATHQADPTLDLFSQWEREDASRSPQQVDADNRLWGQFEEGINDTRRRLSMRQL